MCGPPYGFNHRHALSSYVLGRRSSYDINMRRSLTIALFLAQALFAATIGPSKGTLVIVGGGKVGPEITQKLFDLAGGKDAPIVVIPTADAADKFDPAYLDKSFLKQAGATHLILMHTRDRAVADSKEFVAPLKTAKLVWFVGGRQWRLADAYLNTRTQKELFALLDRGGAIGGSSAGATIQGSYLVRGAVEGNEAMISPGHEVGLGFVKNIAIDQHVITRHREKDLDQVIEKYPSLLGVGIDESTAIVVHGDKFTVIGPSKVFIHVKGTPFYTLTSGDVFDLKARKKVAS
jgi:cyanophycinase